MSVLDRAIAHFDGRKNLKLPVPEWGCDIYYSALSLNERLAMEEKNKNIGDMSLAGAKLVMEKARDKQGQPLFDAKNPDTLEKLQHSVDSKVLLMVANTIMDNPKEAEAAKN